MKPHANVVVVGDSGAGKSTLCAHLLARLGGLDQRVLHALEAEAAASGRPDGTHLAWVLDRLPDERAAGRTVEPAQVDFETNRLQLTLTDAPGAAAYTKNLVASASQAGALPAPHRPPPRSRGAPGARRGC